MRSSTVVDTLAPADAGSAAAIPEISIEPQETRDVLMPETQEFKSTPVYRNLGDDFKSASFALEGPALLKRKPLPYSSLRAILFDTIHPDFTCCK